MAVFPAILQNLFAFSQFPQSQRFLRSFPRARDVQENILRAYLRRNAETVFGREHGFKEIRDIAAYRKQVPIRSYQDFLPYIRQVQQGRQNVLTAEKVLMLHPTGGTSGTKLIPYTRSLKKEFQCALAPWLVDVFSHFPQILSGRSYWTISPPGQKKHTQDRETQTAFDEDSSYFGWKGFFLQHLFAVPPWVTRSESIENFRFLTLFFLLQAGDLSWMSLWSPTFLLVLLEELGQKAESLLASLHNGIPTLPEAAVASSSSFPRKALPERAKELERIFALPPQER
ncbi:MAG: GH3 auxin-responsive promoter family protein, partial [bacterium]|nr:GH3 auxin-responsive promoter family protein [bacterium]